MASLTREGTTVDRCDRCEGVWFDATELDAWLAANYPEGAEPPEERIPVRGEGGGRRCPHCKCAMESAGWTGVILDRCPKCRGLFVEARELKHLEHEEAPHEAHSFEGQFHSAMVTAGWTVLGAKGFILLLLRFLR
jgi:Zn-finger nucleic acid-binding protein